MVVAAMSWQSFPHPSAQEVALQNAIPYFCHFLRFANQRHCPSLINLDSLDHEGLRERQIMRQRDFSPVNPVGVVKRNDSERLKKLIENPESSTYSVEIDSFHQSAKRTGWWHQFPVALGGVAMAVLTLIDSVKIDR